MPLPVSLFAKRPLPEWIADIQHALAPEDRYRALSAVISMGPGPVIAQWCRHALRDADSSLRALAAKQLGELRKHDPHAAAETEWSAIISELTACLDDTDPDVRFEAARSLGRIDPSHAVGRTVLLWMLDDEQTQPLMLAIVIAALGEMIETDTQSLIPRYRRLLSHNQAEVRESVSAAIVRWGRNAQSLIPELIEALEDDEPIVRENAALALGQAGADSQEIQFALTTAESDDDEGVADAARQAKTFLSKI